MSVCHAKASEHTIDVAALIDRDRAVVRPSNVESEKRRWKSEILHFEVRGQLIVELVTGSSVWTKDKDVIDVDSEDHLESGRKVYACISFESDEAVTLDYTAK
jgi:hypothetical protein